MAGGVAPVSNGSSSVGDGKNYSGALAVVTTLFFMWGFITCMNDILIPKFREHFALDGIQAMMVQFCFFTAFFVVSLIYYLVSISKGDPIAKFGYKKAIITGLVICGIGCLIFYPAAIIESYGLFLFALFILASGVTVLQMGANPYVALLGSPEGASSRLNMTQAFNSLGTTIAPIIGGALILSANSDKLGLDSVKAPYVFLAVTLFGLAFMIKSFNLPTIESNNSTEKGIGAHKYRHLVLGVVCIFMYVGGEVSIGSYIINYLGLENIAGLPIHEADRYLAFYWGGAMIGRFFGSIFLDENSNISANTFKLVLIFLFGFTLALFLANKAIIMDMIVHDPAAKLGPWDMTTPLIFSGIIILNELCFFIGKNKPSFTLGIFSTLVVIALFIGITFDGTVAMWSILSIGLFNSIMFPTIFTLAIRGLGIDTGQGSSLLVMAIVGGAFIPPLQGLAESFVGIQISFFVPLLCYIYIAYYGFVGSKPKEVQA